MRVMRNSYQILVVQPQWNKLPGKPRYRWEDSIKMDLKELECESVYWIHVA
jgi:hypothetical protein